MLRIKSIKKNMNELTFGDVRILFSYETPVAGWDQEGAFRTDNRFSSTTTNHINEYFGSKDTGRVVSQEYIEELVDVTNHNSSAW